MMKQNKKLVLVTGAAKRIGRAIALDLASQGYDLAIHYNQSEAEAVALVDEITVAGGMAKAFQADLAREEDAQKLISTVSDAMGPVDVLINNASIFEEEDWQDVTRTSWDRHMDINLRAPFLLMQEMAKNLPDDKVGAIVNIIDQRVWNLTPHYVSYTVAKTGLWTLTQTMALALAPKIRVNAIGPGPTLRNIRQTEADFSDQCKQVPLQRQTSLKDVCEGVRYLITASSITGQMIALDGGEHLGWAQPVRGFIPNE